MVNVTLQVIKSPWAIADSGPAIGASDVLNVVPCVVGVESLDSTISLCVSIAS